jgi:hypothetical protein
MDNNVGEIFQPIGFDGKEDDFIEKKPASKGENWQGMGYGNGCSREGTAIPVPDDRKKEYKMACLSSIWQIGKVLLDYDPIRFRLMALAQH